jgi:hypothetical protein
MKRFLLLFPLLLATPVAAQIPAATTVGQLLQLCQSRYDVDVGICAGFALGVAEGLMAAEGTPRSVCLSPAITPQTLVDNLKRVWSQNAPDPTEPAFAAVERVLRDRFRCP